MFISISSADDPYCLTPFDLSDRFWIGGARSPYARNPFGFQGLHHDEDVGLIYNRARMLNPRLKRFNQRDPLGYPDGMNSYAAYHVLRGGLDPSGMRGGTVRRSGGSGQTATPEHITNHNRIARREWAELGQTDLATAPGRKIARPTARDYGRYDQARSERQQREHRRQQRKQQSGGSGTSCPGGSGNNNRPQQQAPATPEAALAAFIAGIGDMSARDLATVQTTLQSGVNSARNGPHPALPPEMQVQLTPQEVRNLEAALEAVEQRLEELEEQAQTASGGAGQGPPSCPTVASGAEDDGDEEFIIVEGGGQYGGAAYRDSDTGKVYQGIFHNNVGHYLVQQGLWPKPAPGKAPSPPPGGRWQYGFVNNNNQFQGE